jgi:hypothetical protein
MGNQGIAKNQVINSWQSHVSALRETMADEFSHLSDQALTWKPKADKWSIVQCILHLEVSHKIYFHNLEKAFENASPGAEDEVLTTTWIGRQLADSLAPTESGERRMKVPTWKALNPAGEKHPIKNPKLALDLFSKQLEQFDHLLVQNVLLEWNRIRIPTLISPLFKLSVADVIAVMIAHNERHFMQGLNVLEQIKA